MAKQAEVFVQAKSSVPSVTDTPLFDPLQGGGTVEEQLQDIWRTVLGIRDFGPQDNFFELGGNSLSALQVVALVKQRFRCELQAVALYESPTIRLLAERVRGFENPQPTPSQIEDRGEGRLERMARQRRLRRSGPDVTEPN